MASKIGIWWQRMMHWLLGEEGELALNVEELKAGLQAQKEACTRLLALALQAKYEMEAGQKRKQILHQEALALLQQGQEDLALAKSDEEANVDQDIILARERFAKLQAEADRQWQLYQQRAREVKKRLDQVRHLVAEAQVNRLREQAQQVLDSSDLTSAVSRFDETAKNIELRTLMNDARQAVEAELSGHSRMIEQADLILDKSRRQERLAALKQEALAAGSAVKQLSSAAAEGVKQPMTVEVVKKL